VVILDNLSSHKSSAAAAALRDRGAWFLFLFVCQVFRAMRYSGGFLAAGIVDVCGAHGWGQSLSDGRSHSDVRVTCPIPRDHIRPLLEEVRSLPLPVLERFNGCLPLQH
jgi:hypothetical protein